MQAKKGVWITDKETGELLNADQVRKDVADRLEEISQRKDNWDGMGSKAPRKDSLDRAKSVLNGLITKIESV